MELNPPFRVDRRVDLTGKWVEVGKYSECHQAQAEAISHSRTAPPGFPRENKPCYYTRVVDRNNKIIFEYHQGKPWMEHDPEEDE